MLKLLLIPYTTDYFNNLLYLTTILYWPFSKLKLNEPTKTYCYDRCPSNAHYCDKITLVLWKRRFKWVAFVNQLFLSNNTSLSIAMVGQVCSIKYFLMFCVFGVQSLLFIQCGNFSLKCLEYVWTFILNV